jgi:hypothetical protein
MIPKTIIIFLILLNSLFVIVKSVSADAILFPWVVKSQSVSTIISVANTAAGIGGSFEYQSTPFKLHYQYWYKLTTANADTEICTNHSFQQNTSRNDLLSFDAAGNITGDNTLFQDASPYDSEQNLGLVVNGPRRAFLIVDNNTYAFVLYGNSNIDRTLYGEAIILELSGGAAWGYTAYNARSQGVAASPSAQVYFTDGNDYQGEVIGPNERGITIILPPYVFITKFFVTPISAIGQRTGDANVRVQLVIDGNVGGIYDNNENPIDFTKKTEVVCTAAITLDGIITPGVYEFLNSTGRQGFAYIRTDFGTVQQNSSAQAVIGKLEYNEQNGIHLSGISNVGKSAENSSLTWINNFIWIRSSDSIP